MNWLTALQALGDLSLIVIVPAVVFLAHKVWQIKTNDLPHIELSLALLNQQFRDHDTWERNRRGTETK